jgi:aristolochene synthase
MALRISAKELEMVEKVEESYGKLGIVVNDIQSFDKEVQRWEAKKREGAFVVNVVKRIAEDTGLPFEAAKRVCWVLCREWEVEHHQLVKNVRKGWKNGLTEGEKKMEDKDGGGGDVGSLLETLEKYMQALEWVMAGNERWSVMTGRYHG